jgi:hypothetical protein
MHRPAIIGSHAELGGTPPTKTVITRFIRVIQLS